MKTIMFDITLLILSTIPFYSFYSVLFTKFLNKKKIGSLITYGMVISILCGLLYWIVFRIEDAFIKQSNYTEFLQITAFSLLALLNGAVALVIKIFISFYGDIKIKEDLNKKNYEMELALVKNQINPHFLFNTLNNIDVMIAKDSVQASAYLNKLSDIMRFMLYETKTEKIPLAKELAYIEKYIELQKIRTSNTNYVKYLVTGNPEGITVAPMLFIPFIENAFKHTEDKKTENAITIKIDITKEKIVFDCENNLNAGSVKAPGESGLGNELIQKRLMLLYPNSHTLNVAKTDKAYIVKLTISSNAN